MVMVMMTTVILKMMTVTTYIYIDGDDNGDDTEQFQTFSLKFFFLRCQRLSAGRNEIACGGPIKSFVRKY